MVAQVGEFPLQHPPHPLLAKNLVTSILNDKKVLKMLQKCLLKAQLILTVVNGLPGCPAMAFFAWHNTPFAWSDCHPRKRSLLPRCSWLNFFLQYSHKSSPVLVK